MKCRSCRQDNLSPILSLGNQYLADFRSDTILPHRYPLDLMLCNECSLVQLEKTIPSAELYHDNYGYRSGINTSIRNDLADVAAAAQSYITNGTILDIGSNDGTLLSYFPSARFRKIGFEPVPTLARACETHADTVINDYFNARAYYASGLPKANIITAISVFYDMDDPNGTVEDMVSILDPQGIIVIQQNYLVSMMKQNAFDNIVHEHVTYYSLTSLMHILQRFDLRVFDVSLNDINGGSFRTFITPKNSILEPSANVEKLLKEEKSLHLDTIVPYSTWDKKIRSTARNVHECIENIHNRGQKIFLYGASTRGNSLIQVCGLDKSLITVAVERNPEKVGKVLSSFQIPIISEEEARRNKPDYMLVGPWFFKEEFLKRENDYLANGGHFIFPLPSLEII